jgi:hypothetical protein
MQKWSNFDDSNKNSSSFRELDIIAVELDVSCANQHQNRAPDRFISRTLLRGTSAVVKSESQVGVMSFVKPSVPYEIAAALLAFQKSDIATPRPVITHWRARLSLDLAFHHARAPPLCALEPAFELRFQPCRPPGASAAPAPERRARRRRRPEGSDSCARTTSGLRRTFVQTWKPRQSTDTWPRPAVD